MEREREKKKERKKERERERERQKDRETERETERKRERDRKRERVGGNKEAGDQREDMVGKKKTTKKKKRQGTEGDAIQMEEARSVDTKIHKGVKHISLLYNTDTHLCQDMYIRRT